MSPAWPSSPWAMSWSSSMWPASATAAVTAASTIDLDANSGTIDGVAVPEEQMEGARDPADVDPEDLAENGLRPNNRNRVYFQPGPGKVIEEFDSGLVTIELSYFKERQPDTARTVRWQIRVD